MTSRTSWWICVGALVVICGLSVIVYASPSSSWEAQRQEPGEKAVLERTGSLLAALPPADESIWLIMSKIDKDEVLAELHGLRWTFLSILVLSTLLVSGLSHRVHHVSFQRLQQKHLLLKRDLPNEARLAQEVLDAAGSIVVVLRGDGRVRQINKKACDVLGDCEAEILGKDWAESFLPEGDRQEFEQVLSRLKNGSSTTNEFMETEVLSRSGERRRLALHNAVVHDANNAVFGMVLSGEDVTDYVREKELEQAAEAFLGNVINALADSVFVKDESRRFVVVNDALCTMVGKPREDLLGQDADDMFPVEQAAVFRRVDDELLKTGLENVNEERLSNLSTGEERTIITRKTRFIEPDGQKYIVGVIRDQTDCNQAARALEDSEKRYRRLFEAARDGILILEFETGKIVDVNPYLQELVGYSYEEFQGKRLWEIGTFKDIAASENAFTELQTRRFIRYDDLPLRTRDGRKIAVEFVSNVYLVDGHKVIQCNVRDISARKAAEEKVSSQLEELQRWQNVMLDREDRVQELKREVNELCRQAGENPRFSSMEVST